MQEKEKDTIIEGTQGTLDIVVDDEPSDIEKPNPRPIQLFSLSVNKKTATVPYDMGNKLIKKSQHVAVAIFEKVSFDTFLDAFEPIYVAVKQDQNQYGGLKTIEEQNDLMKQAHLIYDNIRLPRRATSRSAGYDFFFPFGYTELGPMVTSTIPTGIKVKINGPYVLHLYPRSSLGFKYRLQLDNTVGIIDADYYNNPNNEGHIFVKITNDSQQGDVCKLNIGDAFCQGVFTQYFITYDDTTIDIRTGGLGSTDSNR